MNDKPPFLLIQGELVQLTDATFGGNGESTWVDHVLCKDGQNRYTLRGETLAGALLATSRKLFNDDVPKCISDAKLKKPSVWRVFTSHPLGEQHNTAIRQNVRINEATGAAEDSALFDSETLAHGTRWSFLLEIDLQRAGSEADKVKAITLQALKHWTEGYCWLGASVARGMGWFKLENVQVTEVSWDVWPDSSKPVEKIKEIQWQSAQLDKLEKIETVWNWKRYQISLAVAPADDGYGIDFLSVGGHSGDALLLDIKEDLADTEHLLLPQTDLTNKNWYADSVFAYTKDKQGNVIPYIPGSSLRGVLRHAAFWWANKQGEDLSSLEHVLTQLFGDIKSKKYPSGAMLISDAHLTKGCDWQAVLLKMHAEDEFAGGVYESSLFDRLALVQACFTATIVIEAKDNMTELDAALQPAIELAKLGFLGLGGQVWRGFGHLCWKIEELKHE